MKNLTNVAEGIPQMLVLANKVKEKFLPIFTAFSKCHRAYNGNVMDKKTIDQLVKSNGPPTS